MGEGKGRKGAVAGRRNLLHKAEGIDVPDDTYRANASYKMFLLTPSFRWYTLHLLMEGWPG